MSQVEGDLSLSYWGHRFSNFTKCYAEGASEGGCWKDGFNAILLVTWHMFRNMLSKKWSFPNGQMFNKECNYEALLNIHLMPNILCCIFLSMKFSTISDIFMNLSRSNFNFTRPSSVLVTNDDSNAEIIFNRTSVHIFCQFSYNTSLWYN